MRFLRYLRRQRSLLAELETERAETARLREELLTAQLQSWIRRPPKAAAPPESELRTELRELRTQLHPVYPARHSRETAPTELHPRAVQRREPLK